MVRLIKTLTVCFILLSLVGCSNFLMPPAYGAPGLPGTQQDIFPCAAFRLDFPNFPIDEISWDIAAGAFQNNNISLNYLPGQFGPIISGIQRNGWSMDNAGVGYFSFCTNGLFTIDTYQSTAGPYKLGGWALFSTDMANLWENLDFAFYDNYIFGLAYDFATPMLWGFWLDTGAPIPASTLIALPQTIGVMLDYSCTRFGDNLFGPLHYIYRTDPTIWYNYQGPPSAGILVSFPTTPDIVTDSEDAIQIIGDFEHRLWVFSESTGSIAVDTAHDTLENTSWGMGMPIPFSAPDTAVWKCATRYTDNTIHAVTLQREVEGMFDWAYQVWYTRREMSGWMAPEMIGSWIVSVIDEAEQENRKTVQITTSPSGVMVWTIQYDAILGIGDVCAYYLDPMVYDDPIAINWTTYLDADGTNYDYWELNAPTFWRP